MSKTSKSFWIIFLLISLVIAVVFTLISNSKQTSSKLPDELTGKSISKYIKWRTLR